MKKLLVVVITLLILQIQNAHAAKVGAKVGYGYNMASVSVGGHSAPGLSNKSGFLVGTSVSESFGPVGAFVDLLYTQRALGFTGTSSTLHYLELPVMANVDLGLFRVNGGVYYALGIGKVHNCLNGACASFSYGSASGFNRSDYGLAIGAGVILPIPAIDITLDLRYKFGLKNISDQSGVDAKWRSLDVIAGVAF